MPDNDDVDDADAWFNNPKSVADRIERNDKRHIRARKRQSAIFLFVVFAFTLLAWRSEVNADRIARQGEQLRADQYAGCLNDEKIIIKYNSLQDELASIDSVNPIANPVIRQRRITAYLGAKIKALDCERMR